MITKERMAELIKQNATIYKIRDNMIINYQLCNYNYLKDNILIYENVITNYCRSWIGSIDDFFETEEDARWELEMTVTRTETLKLPTWEEINKKYIGKEGDFRIVDKKYNIELIYWKFKVCSIEVRYRKGEQIIKQKYFKPATKENYLKACKMVKKLFLGE